MLSIYLIVDMFTVALLLVLMVMALSNGGYRVYLNRLYAAFSIMMAVWLPSIHLGNSLSTPHDIAVFANNLVFGCSFAATILITKIVVIISHLPKERKIFSIAEWFLWPFALVSATPLVGADIEVQDSINGVIFGPLGLVYGMLLAAMVVFMLITVLRGIYNQKGIPRQQLLSLGLAILVVVPLVMLLSYILPVATGIFAFTEFGLMPAVLFTLALYYSVVRHGLFDIRLAVMRTVGYVLAMLVLGIVYIGLAYAFSLIFFHGAVTEGVSFSPVNVLLALLLSLIFQPIKKFFDQLTNKMFFRGEYSRETFFREFGRILSYDTDLKLLLRQSSNYISTNLKAEWATFYIVDRGVYGQNGKRRLKLPIDDIEVIAKYYTDNYEPPSVIVTELVKSKRVSRLLLGHQIHLALPMTIQGQPIGFLFLGEHKSRGYTARDVSVLESIANELTIAVQNSLSVEEIRDLNENLQRRVDEATRELRTTNRQLQRLDEAKNEFISMASHQLRTPLTSIKGYLDMVLQGDLGRVGATQRAVLSEAFISSERMVSLINDFLNISRLQTGKFVIERRESDLGEAIKEQLKMLRVLAKQHDLTLKESIGEDVPMLSIDIEKLRQVTLNFIDNAIYYSQPGTTIKIDLTKDKDSVIFTVKDTGIGVPEAEQSGLFSKFFRGSNARKRRPDGTGVGLFLAKKVILAHGGEVIFESIENKGSTFGFRIPIKQPKNLK